MSTNLASHITEDTQDMTCAHCGRNLKPTWASREAHRYSSAHETIVAWSCGGKCAYVVELMRQTDGTLNLADVEAHRPEV